MADDKKTKGDTKAEKSSEPESDTKVENNSEPKGDAKVDSSGESKDDAKVDSSSEPKKAAAKIGILAWAIVAVVVLLCAGSGFFVGRLFAGSDEPQAQPSQADQSASSQVTAGDTLEAEGESESLWYYDLEPVVANLDEPGVTRYVRATITMEISSVLEQVKSEKLLDQKKPILKNWLTIYLASLTLEDTRGDRNLKRIQSQILDAFNEKLFPDAKPQIKNILFKEFAVQ
ncbi:MAG: flagellar basal body-associated FliL family protein [Phycisphaerae bacterium]|jgi:flagellar basal body-associated protein FliL